MAQKGLKGVKMRIFSDKVPEPLQECRQLYINLFVRTIGLRRRYVTRLFKYNAMQTNSYNKMKTVV